MDSYVAIRAVLITRIGHVVSAGEPGNAGAGAAKCARSVMAFQAHGEDHRASQQTGVGGTVRGVARFAAFHTHRRMLKGERPAFIKVTFQTSFFVDVLLDHVGPGRHAPGGRRSAMRIVAIAASHEPFVDAMLEGHVELRANIGVAAVTKLRLAFGQQKFGRRCLVYGVTLSAANVVERVDRAMDVRAGETFGMAAQTGLRCLLRRQQRECANGGLAAMGLDMGFAGTMAAFTAGVFGFFFFAGDALEVGILVEAGPNVGVAGFTNRTADEFAGRVLGEGGRRQDREEQSELCGVAQNGDRLRIPPTSRNARQSPFRIFAMHASRLGRYAGECRWRLVKVL